jgi:hypothetical protein
MPHRAALRAVVLALVGILALAGTAAADTVPADGDVLTADLESTVDLGKAAPGAEVTVQVGFTLVCGNLSHVDVGQTVTLTPGSRIEPGDGAIVSATNGTVGPVPSGWTADGEGCPFPAPTLSSATTSVLTLRAPTVPGTGYSYTLMYDRSLSPGGSLDSGALRSATAVTFILEVVANTPPTLTLPAGGTVEGDTTGGWIAAWTGLGATDVQDDPDPVPTCVPAAGSVLPLGTTTVACSVTDSGGLTTSGNVDVTVVDTTDPSIGAIDDQAVTTDDPVGHTLDYDLPSATDTVDAAPTVGCSPAAGAVVPVGTTTVTCTATDDSGNTASTSFDVTVSFVPTHVTTATWGEPVGPAGSFTANRGRTLPVKVTLSVDGVVQTEGSAVLEITPCSGGSASTVPLTFGGGRWNAALDTSSYAGPCHIVTAVLDGSAAGSFRLDLTGAEAAKKARRSP